MVCLEEEERRSEEEGSWRADLVGTAAPGAANARPRQRPPGVATRRPSVAGAAAPVHAARQRVTAAPGGLARPKVSRRANKARVRLFLKINKKRVKNKKKFTSGRL